MNPSTIPHAGSRSDAALALAGPMAIGAILGLERGFQSLGVVRDSVVLPLLLLGVTAAMIPALYIATSLAGVAPPARRVGAAVLRGLRACGVIMLGLAAPAAFLLATTTSSAATLLLGGMVTAAGVLAGLRVLFADLFDSELRPLSARFVFALWALVSLSIGVRMYGQFMAA
jgi:hypothetical protein